MARASTDAGAVRVLFGQRTAPIQHLAEQAGQIADACRAMAARFHDGGKLVVFGSGEQCADAQHVAVEFVHPVIVGKRALPAISLTGDVATLTGVASRAGFAEIFTHQLRFLAEPHDIALGLAGNGNHDDVVRALAHARQLGMLTVAMVGADPVTAPARLADHVLTAHSADPRVVKEVHVTTYHLLWELVHVFLERPDPLASGAVA
ncbi:D-sedoheptulose-7-phosphate isomerase [Goodfellowiella coeruleoviolacea]|uniref:D-sedoheptulose 7-phosphate isomerase n=1 Tax=Goodfellowiella coeruleoviolacea TaxID=334858 RepID=A0AAE3G914_9PSEU|nr:SIS domain-containing protein [Goodfellowiella coeruleoviolacea]MCP2163488.1 D-sedoheptulose 7-phosphate isomerase [Goodfellowiella coeruleoviolacea]